MLNNMIKYALAMVPVAINAQNTLLVNEAELLSGIPFEVDANDSMILRVQYANEHGHYIYIDGSVSSDNLSVLD